MGKKKTKRFGALRPNPISMLGDQGIDPNCEDSMDDSVPASIANIIEKIQAPESEERECGCQLLASCVSQPRCMDLLLQENVVKIVAPLFLDPSREVRNSALGALRNMSVCGDEHICDGMVASDILTPLAALLKEYTGWTPDKSSPQTNSCEVLTEALGLMANLCESSSRAVKIFNKENFLPFLLPLLKYEDYGYPVAYGVARLLHIVSEDNTVVTSVLQSGEFLATLQAILSVNPSGVEAVLLRTFVIGILLNLSDVDLSAHYQGMVKALAAVVEMDCLSLVMTALDGKKKEAQEASGSENVDTWPDVIRLIQAQGIAMELLANFCCSEDEWEEMDCEGSEESSDDQNGAGVDCEEMEGQGSMCLPSEVHAAFLESAVLSKILKKAHPIDSAQKKELQKSQAGKDVLQRLRDLESRALLCLSNMLSAMDDTTLSKSDTALPEVWANVYSLAKHVQESCCTDENHRWAVSSSMRATLQKMAEVNTDKFGDVSESDISFLVSFGSSCKNHETQVNVVRIISTVGCVLSSQNPPHPLLPRIGTVLLDVACGSEDLHVVSEALDSIFDVFKEDHTDPVVREIGLISRLKQFQPTFKANVASQRKKLGENYGIVMMAKTNLAAYLKYKTSKG